jgi:ferritin-like metal-binding protein YciE
MYKEFKKVFVNELKDIYNAEKQLSVAYPRIAKAAHSKELKEVISKHGKEAKQQLKRLKDIFSIVGAAAHGMTCEATTGLIKECMKTIKEYPLSAARDMAIITKLQRIEHYEIAVYGSLKAFAKRLELDEVSYLLGESLKEEQKADAAFTKIAEGGLFTTGVNKEALTRKQPAKKASSKRTKKASTKRRKK